MMDKKDSKVTSLPRVLSNPSPDFNFLISHYENMIMKGILGQFPTLK